MGAFRFERLEVWQKSVEWGDRVCRVADKFPTREQFGLASQMRRSAVSVSANIAEGSSRASDKDFSRFVEIAFGSLCETVSHLRMALLRNLVSQDEHKTLYDDAEDLGKMLSALRNHLGKWKKDSGAG